MSVQCPKCPRTPVDEMELYRHLRDFHKLTPEEIKRLLPGMKTPGYFEHQTDTPDGRVAINHQEAAVRSQMNKDPALNVPLIPLETKKELRVPKGWRETHDGHIFEKTISEKHTEANIIKEVLKAEVTTKHMRAVLYTYEKDISELSQLENKKDQLRVRLAGLVDDDPRYLSVLTEFQATNTKIEKLRKELEADKFTETKLEEYYLGDLNTDEHIDWKSEMMDRVIKEADRLIEGRKKEIRPI